MAKEDFCFTYYDGDATRDTSHMNRLERGAYHDIVISQRKFGRLTIDQIKKILGKDFQDCWPAIELIMKSEEGKFYIEWLGNSIEKMRRQAKHQSQNGKLGGRKPNETQTQAKSKPTPNPNQSELKPLGDGDGIGDESVLETEIENFLVPEMQEIFKRHNPKYNQNRERDYKPLLSIAEFLMDQGKLEGSPEENKRNIMAAWDPLCRIISKDKFYSTKTLSTISKQIQEITQFALHGKSNGKPDYGSPERANEYDRLFAERYGKGGSATG